MPDVSKIRFPQSPQPEVALGWIVRDRREALGLAQREVALRGGLDIRLINDVDRGKRSPHLYAFLRLARGLATTPDRLSFDVHQTLLRENPSYADFYDGYDD